MKRVLLALMILGCFSSRAADPLISSNMISWSTPGIVGHTSGAYTFRQTVFTNIGVGETIANINVTLAACPSNQVVVLPAGTWNLGATDLNLTNYLTLRGAGAGLTIIKIDGAGN